MMWRPTPQTNYAPQFILDDLELGHWVAISLHCENVHKFGAWINPRNFEMPNLGVYTSAAIPWIYPERGIYGQNPEKRA